MGGTSGTAPAAGFARTSAGSPSMPRTAELLNTAGQETLSVHSSTSWTTALSGWFTLTGTAAKQNEAKQSLTCHLEEGKDVGGDPVHEDSLRFGIQC